MELKCSYKHLIGVHSLLGHLPKIIGIFNYFSIIYLPKIKSISRMNLIEKNLKILNIIIHTFCFKFYIYIYTLDLNLFLARFFLGHE